MLTRLTLSNFRSYAALTIEPGPDFVVLTGANGVGKTNVLEAVSLLAPGRGLRSSVPAEMARKGGEGSFAVAADVSGVRLGTGVEATVPNRRVARINGATAPIAALSDWVSIIWLTPAQDRLFTDSPGERRRFLDRLVVALDPGHAHHSTRYEAAMRQRNRLLAEGNRDESWLSALEAAMSEHGDAVSRARQQAVAAITRVQLTASNDYPPFRMQLANAPDYGALVKKLESHRGRDAALGRALDGPHSDDLCVAFAAKDQPAAQSSTGEQKALLLGIVLAHAALVAESRGRPPVLLLDEVAAHLDPARRESLFGLLADTAGQVWLTGTEAAPFATLKATRFTVREGGIIEP